MLEELRKYLEQAKQIEGTDLEKILVTRNNLGVFSNFWEQNSQTLMLFAAVALHKYESEVSFTKEELQSFKQGLASFGVFFDNCFKLNKQLEQQEKNKGLDKK
jgi:hypothetical protein